MESIASFARTFKEGQALLGPVQMVFILPAMAGAIPGLELTPGLACVPVVSLRDTSEGRSSAYPASAKRPMSRASHARRRFAGSKRRSGKRGLCVGIAHPRSRVFRA